MAWLPTDIMPGGEGEWGKGVESRLSYVCWVFHPSLRPIIVEDKTDGKTDVVHTVSVSIYQTDTKLTVFLYLYITVIHYLLVRHSSYR